MNDHNTRNDQKTLITKLYELCTKSTKQRKTGSCWNQAISKLIFHKV